MNDAIAAIAIQLTYHRVTHQIALLVLGECSKYTEVVMGTFFK